MLRQARNCDIRKELVAGKTNVFELKTDPIMADPGDKIRWEVIDSHEHVISVWFPGPCVFASPVVASLHRGPVEAEIRDDAKPGVYEYAIYDHTEGLFVTCRSHPKLEIPGP